MDDEAQQRIRSYFRESQARYTPDAIRRQLLDAGYTDEQIDGALVGHEPAPAPQLFSVRWRATAISLALFIGAAVVVGVVYGNSNGTYVPDVFGSTAIALIYFLPGFLISLVVIGLAGSRPVDRARLAGALATALVVPTVVVLAMTGFCLAQARV